MLYKKSFDTSIARVRPLNFFILKYGWPISPEKKRNTRRRKYSFKSRRDPCLYALSLTRPPVRRKVSRHFLLFDTLTRLGLALELQMASIGKVSCFDVVLKVQSSGNALENTCAATLYNRVLATSKDLRA